ncbi:MAG: hypothetical protein P1P88_14550, partial [Bacteroidales bacterium]|nr:hypothetical protein [Bacteroidales bacterium]
RLIDKIGSFLIVYSSSFFTSSDFNIFIETYSFFTNLAILTYYSSNIKSVRLRIWVQNILEKTKKSIISNQHS